MAAIETEFMIDGDAAEDAGLGGTADAIAVGASNMTIAPFSPDQTVAPHRRAHSSVLIHQKSPLLLATPPQVTRALAYSHPFLLPLNHLAGLLTWSTNDQWESFLLLAAFWFAVLYGDTINRFAGPLVIVTAIIFAMYARRYSPLSSSSWMAEKKRDKKSKAKKEQKKTTSSGPEQEEGRKSLDEILDTLQTFTNRCNVLIDPFLSLTEFLSTQTTATAATTRPALMSMLLRVLIISPIWTILSLPPLYIITTQRVVLVLGTILLTYHSTVAQVTRALLWRSRLIRYATSVITGLNVANPARLPSLSTMAKRINRSTKGQPTANLRFTFTIYENQRRWLGLGWTTSLMSYERAAWTDSQLNPSVEPDQFVLPETNQASTEWRWVVGSEWHVEGASHDDGHSSSGHDDDEGWVYFDTAWQSPRSTDGWGRYTRRRRWVRDAELVDLAREAAAAHGIEQEPVNGSKPPMAHRRSWFGRRRTTSQQIKAMDTVAAESTGSDVSRSRDDPEEDVLTPLGFRQKEWAGEMGEGLAENLG